MQAPFNDSRGIPRQDNEEGEKDDEKLSLAVGLQKRKRKRDFHARQ
jgi:hypothetical protein